MSRGRAAPRRRGLLAAAALAGLGAGCASAPHPPPAEQLAIRQRSAAATAQRHDDPRTAASLYARASRTAASGDQPALAADAACRHGLALLSAGDAAGALGPLARAAELARGAGEPALAARAWLGLARARQALQAGAAGGAPSPGGAADGGAGAGPAGVAEALREARALAVEGKDATAEALAEVGLGARSPPAEARGHFAAAARLAGSAPEVAGPLALNRARLAEREGDLAAARAGFRAALAPLAEADDRPGLLVALRAAARLADADPAARAEAADLHRRASAVAAGLGRRMVAEEESAAAAKAAAGP